MSTSIPGGGAQLQPGGGDLGPLPWGHLHHHQVTPAGSCFSDLFLTRTQINSFLLVETGVDPKEEMHEDEVEFDDDEEEGPDLDMKDLGKVSKIPPSLVPKEDYDSDPGALDADFIEDSRVKEEEDEDLYNSEDQLVFKVPPIIILFRS